MNLLRVLPRLIQQQLQLPQHLLYYRNLYLKSILIIIVIVLLFHFQLLKEIIYSNLSNFIHNRNHSNIIPIIIISITLAILITNSNSIKLILCHLHFKLNFYNNLFKLWIHFNIILYWCNNNNYFNSNNNIIMLGSIVIVIVIVIKVHLDQEELFNFRVFSSIFVSLTILLFCYSLFLLFTSFFFCLESYVSYKFIYSVLQSQRTFLIKLKQVLHETLNRL